ncbi:hypothetical protein E0H46_26105 [Rhizobium leguminosarum bv. viciae]|nr:hypothetical protein E0H46_26105 [Rhizobium leguminosarum bv. viciae]TCA33064.1 hypothetical protein E0H70_08870 [Rhizobium leguminosarum bv. viciae]
MKGVGQRDVSERHGFIRPNVDVTTLRREAARELMRAFEDGPNLERFARLRQAAALLSDMFFMIREQKRAEWFLTSGLMSHPTPPIARNLGKRLQHLALSCERRDVALVSEQLQSMKAVAIRLEGFLACTRAVDPVEAIEEARWIYLVRNRAEFGVANLGEIHGRVQDALQELEDLNPHFGSYSLAGAWRVHDLRAGYAIAAMALQPSFIQTDFYDFRDFETLASMGKSVSAALQEYRLLIGMPTYFSSSWSRAPRPDHTLAPATQPVDDEEDVVETTFAP